MSGRFGAVLTAMATPFDDDLALDLDAAAELARWLQDHGNDGLVVAGTTGEAPTLSDDEKVDLWRAVQRSRHHPGGRRHGLERHRQRRSTCPAGRPTSAWPALLVVGPYYNRPPQSGIEAHFRAVAAATELPVIVYDVPTRTGRRIAHDVLVRLGTEVPNIVGLKDATGDPPGAARLVAEHRRLRHLQRRRRHDPAAAGGRCRRRHRHVDPLDRPRDGRDDRRLREG